MKFKNLFLFLILLVIFIIGCNQTAQPQPPKTAFQPVAWLSGQPGAVNLTPTEGNGPFQCAITAGALPQGFNLNNCVISGTAPVLAGGTTKSISPPFTITITNAAGQQQTIEYNILTVASLPAIIFNEPGTCIVKQKCDVNLIAQVNGGVPPYHFQSDTFRNGAPPMGMIVDVNGVLTGTPSKTGQYTFGVCVVDVVAASKCGQTSVFVIDEEEIEEIASYGESSGLCSSNSDCTGFAANNCDAPENVRCSKDGLCHCCLTLCPGGENCKCIGCSTGCGGGTYCEGDVCVFESGGSPSGEQTTESEESYTSEEYYAQETTEENEFALNVIGVGSMNSVYQKVFESDGAYRSRAFVLGTVTSSPAGINCNNIESCNALFPKDTMVTLTATSSNGAKFSGWSGACSGTGSCVVKMSYNKEVDYHKEVIAIFDPGLSVNIQSAACSPRNDIGGGDLSASGSATGPVGVVLSVIPGSLSISCGSWKFDGSFCIRGPNDPQTTSWSFQNYYTPFDEDKVTAEVFVTLNNAESGPTPVPERAKAETSFSC